MHKRVSETMKAFIFIAILMLLLSGLSQIMRPKDNKELDWKHDQVAHGILGEPAGTVDVLFFGDSEVFTSIIPLSIWEQQGITSYCCGTSRQSLWYTLQIMIDSFQKQNPKIVVLETNAIFRYFTMDDFILHGAEFFFSVFKYHDRWKSISLNDVVADINNTYVHSEKGFHFAKDIDPASTQDYMSPSKHYAPIPFVDQFYINLIASFCREHGSKLILLSTPSTKNWNMSRHNTTAELAKRLEADYVDLNLLTDEVPIDWSHDTKDKGDHVNIYGANKVTAYVGKYLAHTGILPDHRNDPAYSSWKKDAADFRKKYKQYLT